ncbi:MAG: CARDB domain-containing protein [Candidatus Altiarchaeia archaeon]|jgi:hypothetical protein
MVMTYGWIFVVGIGAVILMSQMGLFMPAPVEKTKYGFSQLMPVDWGVYMDSNQVVSRVENWAGDKVQIIGMHVALDEVSCDSAGTVLMEPGRSAIIIMTCSDSPSLSDKFVRGSGYIAEVTISYIDVASGAAYVSKGTVRGPVEEGSVTTTTIPPQADLTIDDLYVDVGGVKVRPTTPPASNPSGPIKYVISNPGDNVAGQSHSSISVNGVTTNPTVVSIGNGTGPRVESSGQNYPVPCPGEGFTVSVCVDSDGEVSELNEENNCISAEWKCALIDNPPVVELISPCDCCDEGGNFVGCP